MISHANYTTLHKLISESITHDGTEDFVSNEEKSIKPNEKAYVELACAIDVHQPIVSTSVSAIIPVAKCIDIKFADFIDGSLEVDKTLNDERTDIFSPNNVVSVLENQQLQPCTNLQNDPISEDVLHTDIEIQENVTIKQTDEINNLQIVFTDLDTHTTTMVPTESAEPGLSEERLGSCENVMTEVEFNQATLETRPLQQSVCNAECSLNFESLIPVKETKIITLQTVKNIDNVSKKDEVSEETKQISLAKVAVDEDAIGNVYIEENASNFITNRQSLASLTSDEGSQSTAFESTKCTDSITGKFVNKEIQCVMPELFSAIDISPEGDIYAEKITFNQYLPTECSQVLILESITPIDKNEAYTPETVRDNISSMSEKSIIRHSIEPNTLKLAKINVDFLKVDNVVENPDEKLNPSLLIFGDPVAKKETNVNVLDVMKGNAIFQTQVSVDKESPKTTETGTALVLESHTPKEETTHILENGNNIITLSKSFNSVNSF